MKPFPTILVIAAVFLLAFTPRGVALIYIVGLSWPYIAIGLVVIALAIVLFAAIRGKLHIAWAIFPVAFFGVCGAIFFIGSRNLNSLTATLDTNNSRQKIALNTQVRSIALDAGHSALDFVTLFQRYDVDVVYTPRGRAEKMDPAYIATRAGHMDDCRAIKKPPILSEA